MLMKRGRKVAGLPGAMLAIGLLAPLAATTGQAQVPVYESGSLDLTLLDRDLPQPPDPGAGSADEQANGSAVEDMVVVSTATGASNSGPTPAPCGLQGIVWSVAHPASAWRLVAPLPPGADAEECFNARTSLAGAPLSAIP